MKIPSKRLASDDCLVHVGRKIADGKIINAGTPYAVHLGEWIEVMPVASIGQLLALVQLQAEMNDPARAVHAFEELCRQVANKILAWNWTGLDDMPLAQPHNNVEVIKSLSDDELAWLVRAIGGETPGERKNA